MVRSGDAKVGRSTSRSFGMVSVKNFHPPGDLDPYPGTNALNQLHRQVPARDRRLQTTTTLWNRMSRFQSLDLGGLLAGDAGAGSIVDLGLCEPAPHGLARDAFLASRTHLARSWGSIFFGTLSILPDSNSSGIKP